MFYITIHRKNGSAQRRAGDAGNFSGTPLQYAVSESSYQIYENGRPLLNMRFATRREARKRLKSLESELRQASNGWYQVECKLSPYLSVGNVIGFRKIYGDGSSVDVTYVIRKISTSLVM